MGGGANHCTRLAFGWGSVKLYQMRDRRPSLQMIAYLVQ